MSRIPFPEGVASERVRWLLARIPPLNLLKMESWAEGAVEAIVRLSDGVLNLSEVDPVLRQVAVLRLCTAVGCAYEFELLAQVSKRYAMSDDLIAAAGQGSTNTQLTQDQRMAARLAEELAHQARASDEVMEYLRARLPPRHIVELVVSVGFYLMQSRVIATLDICSDEERVDLSGRGIDQEQLDAWRNGRV